MHVDKDILQVLGVTDGEDIRGLVKTTLLATIVRVVSKQWAASATGKSYQGIDHLQLVSPGIIPERSGRSGNGGVTILWLPIRG